MFWKMYSIILMSYSHAEIFQHSSRHYISWLKELWNKNVQSSYMGLPAVYLMLPQLPPPGSDLHPQQLKRHHLPSLFSPVEDWHDQESGTAWSGERGRGRFWITFSLWNTYFNTEKPWKISGINPGSSSFLASQSWDSFTWNQRFLLLNGRNHCIV